MNKAIVDRPPGALLRFGLHLPIWIYRLKLGWLFGKRFLMLTHTGRKSGMPHETIIEVVRHNRETDIYYVASGWGERSDWFQNIRKSPKVKVRVGLKQFSATATVVDQASEIEILRTYIQHHPIAFKELSRLFLGERLQADATGARRMAETMPMVAFQVEQETKREVL